MKPSQLAINSISTSGKGLEDRLSAYADAGFRNVEFYLPHLKDFLKTGKTTVDVNRLLESHQLRVIGGFEGIVRCFADKEEWSQNRQQIIANARLLHEIGGGGVLVVGTDGPANPTKDPLGVMARRFATLGRQIARFDVRLAIEFNWSPLIKSLRTAVEVARRSEEPNIGVLLDPAHYHCTPTKFDQINAENVPFIQHVHVNDMADKPGELSNCNDDRRLPGEGILDLQALFRALQRHGYDGFYSIEMFDKQIWKLNARNAAQKLYESLLPFTTGR